MKRPLRTIRLGVVGLVILVWTLLPIYHMALWSVMPPTAAFAGKLWPDQPTAENYRTLLTQDHPFVAHFWRQLGNSVFVAVVTVVLVLFVASLASFALGRLRLRGGHVVSNLALLTYLIPAAFLAIPLYRVMGDYGLLESRWSVILSMVTFAAPYAIWVLRQYGETIPIELDEAARVDGATPGQLFWHIFLPLIAPALVAIGAYAFFLSWNEYLFAFLFLAKDENLTIPVVLGHILTSDDAPWTLLMATAIIYSLPPVLLYYAFRKHMTAGLVSGGVKG